MNRLPLILALCLLSASALAAPKTTSQSINDAAWSDNIKPDEFSPAVVKLEVLLSQSHFSPGEIDGRLGENIQKAAAAYADENHLGDVSKSMKPVWDRFSSSAGDPVIVDYVITKEDISGPFLKNIPAKMEKMKGLKHLSYRNSQEALAEKFHMSPDLLQRLNPGKNFKRAGDTISVAAANAPPMHQNVIKIEVDVNHQTLKAFSKDDQLLAYYPATVGSEEKPAPTGTFKVKGIAKNPIYHYNPKYAFKSVKTKKRFTIAAGPNNPVGTTWIDLSAKSYGIHGTPEPSKISKSESHGCIRLTNWDVQELASMVRRGTKVVIESDKDMEASASATKSPQHRR